MAFRLGAFNLPVVEGGAGEPGAIYTGAGYYFVFKNSAHPELGVDFLRFMTSREMAGTFAEMRDVLVAVNGAMEGRTSEDLQDLVTNWRSRRRRAMALLRARVSQRWTSSSTTCASRSSMGR